ncbi:MAG: metallophosphoesterase [Thiomonas arsenitoxydans]|nr:metallophosphoesterase [Thiomonas arsenitoxydans]
MSKRNRPVVAEAAEQESELHEVYAAWLQSVVPDFDGAMRAVANARVRDAMRLTLERAGPQPGVAACRKHGAAGRAVWVWSDLHLGHEAILRHARRPFGNAQHMAAELQARALAAGMAPDDWLICPGDLAFIGDAEVRAWLRGIPGRKVLILGNHDVDGRHHKNPLRWGLEGVTDSLELTLGSTRLWLTHYPIDAALLPAGVVNVHGHIHQHLVEGQKHLNVCVEHTGYRPLRLDEVLRQHGLR